MSNHIKSNTENLPDAGISIDASDTAQPMRHEATISDARTNAPREEATQALTVGGNGKDGTLSVLAADGQPLFQTVRGSVGLNGALSMSRRIDRGTVAGLLQLISWRRILILRSSARTSSAVLLLSRKMGV